jgi:hypothetical protein
MRRGASHERATAVSRTGATRAASGHIGTAVKLTAVLVTGCGLWLLGRKLHRRTRPDVLARHDGQAPVQALAKVSMRLDWTRRRDVGLDWDAVDEASAQSFPASDPPGFYLLSL